MKKIILLTAAVVLSASFSTATAGKKKDKKKKAETEQVVVAPAEEPVVLATFNDSLSYAAGKTATNGLIPYLVQQLKVDTAYMADFVKGFTAATEHKGDPVYAAYQAGVQIAQMANQRILPSMKADFEGSDKVIADDLFYKGFVAALMRDNSIYTDTAALSFFDHTNKQVKEQVAARKTPIAGLSHEKASLSEKVAIASQLDATNIQLKALKKNDKEVKKIKDCKTMQVSFTITRNVTASNGNRTVYVRIQNPGGNTLNGGGTFAYENRNLQYTMKKNIEYTGEETSLTLFWQVTQMLEAGDYRVSIFVDGNMIGSRTFSFN